MMELKCFLLIHSTVDRSTGSEGFERIDFGERNAIISFLVNSVGVWKASVFDHDEVLPALWHVIFGYCLRKSLHIYT